MSILTRMFGGNTAAAHPSDSKVADASALTWESLYGSPASKAGVSVNVDSALRVSTVLACCRVLAEGIAQLPLKLLKEERDGSKTLAKAHPTYNVLYRQPNEWMTSFEFRETAMYHALLAKGAFAIKNIAGGKVTELYPVAPGAVTVRQAKNFDVVYEINDGNGKPMVFPRSQVFHLRGPSWNGVTGIELVTMARDAIGLAIASEESQARLHSNGVRPSGLISTEGKLGSEAVARLREHMNAVHQSVENVGKILILDQGAKFTPFSMTGVDAQHLQTRQHQVEEIARMFRVFPQMIGYSDKTSTYASAEQFFIAHVVHSLGPWIERWEQAIYRDLIADGTRENYYAKFFVQGLLRGDAVSRSTFYKNAINDGWMSRNEVRALEDLDPERGLERFLVPLNMGDGQKPPQDPAQPKPAPPKTPEPAMMGDDGEDMGDEA